MYSTTSLGFKLSISDLKVRRFLKPQTSGVVPISKLIKRNNYYDCVIMFSHKLSFPKFRSIISVDWNQRPPGCSKPTGWLAPLLRSVHHNVPKIASQPCIKFEILGYTTHITQRDSFDVGIRSPKTLRCFEKPPGACPRIKNPWIV